jgi:general nucleoside transport system permease protein
VSAPPEPPEAGAQVTVASRLSGVMRAGGIRGIIPPVVTALIAFVAGGLVVLATGRNPLSTYEAIFKGTGLNWFWPFLGDEQRTLAALNLQQTLILTTPLILVGLAVAIAFRAGLFNIGGQGQYAVGGIAAVFIGTRFDSLPGVLHIVLAIVAAMAAGAVWAGIAGFLRARTGANEVISTIMLNYVALWIGVYLFGLDGPLQNTEQPSVPVSSDIAEGAHLPVFWGDPLLQGAHIGLFIALAGAAFAWVLLNRSVAGFKIRAVGFNPDAAEYGGINAGRQQIKAMAICGLLAGLAGAMDVLGWQFRLATNDIQTSQIGFLGIAVALLGRNTAIGTVFAALLFGALVNGTSVRNLDPNVFPPELASNLTLIIQGLIVLLVSAPVIATKLLGWRVRMAGGRR